MRKIISLLCVFFLSFHYLHSSENNDEKLISGEWQIGGMIHRGKMLNHSSLLAPIIERYAVGGEIFLSKQTYGKNHWNSFFNYPEYGISYTFLNLGSPNYAGMAHCLFPYMNFRFLNNKNPFNLELKVGAGLAYVEKIYNEETNPLNHAFSTHLNAVLNGKFQGSFELSKDWSLFAGIGINHISNGSFKKPNLGVNIYSLFTGFSYSFGKENDFIYPASKINEKNKIWDCSVFLSTGRKEVNPIGGDKYSAYDFSVEVTKKHFQYTRFGLSLDITYDESDYDCIIMRSQPIVERWETTRVGVSGGYVLLFGRLSLDAYVGVYLHEKDILYTKIYQRTSLRYPLTDRLKLSLSLRNNRGKADFIGLGLGYRLIK